MSDAKNILDERLAKGEISDSEYDRLSSKIAAEINPTNKSIHKSNLLKFIGSWKFIVIIATIGAIGKLSARYFDRSDYSSKIIGDWTCLARNSDGEQLNIKMVFDDSRFSASILLDNGTSSEVKSSGAYALKIMGTTPYLSEQVREISFKSSGDGGTNILAEVNKDYSFTLSSAIVNGASSEAAARQFIGPFVEGMKEDNTDRIVELTKDTLILSEDDGTGTVTCSH